jgi:hypothetical protein
MMSNVIGEKHEDCNWQQVVKKKHHQLGPHWLCFEPERLWIKTNCQIDYQQCCNIKSTVLIDLLGAVLVPSPAFSARFFAARARD